jgi:type IV fimbrial biogenesis protein FimT
MELYLYSIVDRTKPTAARSKSRATAAGFTLIELLVALAVGAILVTIAIPAFRTLLRNYQLSTQADDFLGSVQTARSEAVKRSASVVLCAVADSTVALPNCTAGAATAWMVFVASIPNTGQPASAAAILELHPNLANGVLLRADSTQSVTFLATGFPAVGAHLANVVFCDSRGLLNQTPTTGRAVQLSLTGHGSVVSTFAGVTAALAATGQTCP